jgi:thymidylate synthase
MEDRGPIIEGPTALFEVASLTWEDPILREHTDLVATLRWVKGRPCRSAQEEYRARLRDMQGVDRLRWVVDLLRARPWTTSAWIALAVPGEPADAMPCLAAVSFRIRGYQLIMTATFRSQNVFRGYLSYVPLRGVQQEVADELGLPVGPMRVFVDVPYVEVSDAERVAGILTALPENNAA